MLTSSTPRMASCAPGKVFARCSVRASEANSTSSTSELLPLPLGPVTTVNVPSGICTVMFLRLLCRAPTISRQPSGKSGRGERGEGRGRRRRRSALNGVFFAVRFRASSSPLSPLPSPLSPQLCRFVGTGIAFLPERYGPVTEPRRRATCSGVPWATICPPSRPAAGTEVEQLVGVADHLAVVLDHQERVAQVAELFQGVEQPAVVAGMQADRRLVEHVEHAAQAAAHLGRQADPLHLAAGKRRGGPGKRQIVEAHVDQELQPVADLAAHLAGDLPLGVAELPAREIRPAACPSGRRQKSSIVRLRSRTAAASSRSRLPPQTEHSTSSTRCSSSSRKPARRGWLPPTPDRGPCIGSETAPQRLSPGVDAGAKRSAIVVFLVAALGRGPTVEPLLAGAVENQPAVRPPSSSKGTSIGMPVPRENASSIRVKIGLPALGQRPTAPWASVSFGSRSRAAGFVPVCVPKPFAGRAPAQGAVEREVVRRERLEAPPATVADEVLAVRFHWPARLRHVVARMRHAQHAAPQRQGVLDAAGDPRAGVGADRHAVDHHLDVVLPPAVDLAAAGRPSRSGRRRGSRT